MEDSFKEKIKNIVSSVKFDEPMKNHTTFRTGGPAEVFLEPTITELPRLIGFLYENNINYIVTGNGSNLLISDKGLEGVVINIGKNFSDKSIVTERKESDSEILIVPAGILLSNAAHEALSLSLTGMEALSGIPGSIGGALYMNAGAYGSEMKDIVSLAETITYDGVVHSYKADELRLSYRHSRFMDFDIHSEDKADSNDEIAVSLKEFCENRPEIITCVQISLKKGNEDEIREKMSDLNKKRKEKQPLDFPSAGSTFKRPEGNFAGKLIEESGLKGFSIGNAQVSEKHAGFVINKGNASSKEIYLLIEEVQKTVYEKQGVLLQPEVRMLGDFS